MIATIVCMRFYETMFLIFISEIILKPLCLRLDTFAISNVFKGQYHRQV